MQKDSENGIEEIAEDTEKEIQALNKITLALLEQQRKNNKSLLIIIIALIVCMCSMVVGFFWYESQFETTTETKIIEQSADGENSGGNNIEMNQYEDTSAHNENVSEDK